MASSDPQGGGTPSTPTQEPESHKLRDGIVLAVAGALATGIIGLVTAAVTNSTLVSGSGGVVVGSGANLPTSTVTTEVQAPVVTETVTRPPTTVTVTQEPAAGSSRRSGDINLPTNASGSAFGVDLDTLEADWRYQPSQSASGMDLVGFPRVDSLGMPSGGLLLTGADDPADPSLQARCSSSTGYVTEIGGPRNGQLYCVKTDEGRIAVARVNDDALESRTFVLSLVVW